MLWDDATRFGTLWGDPERYRALWGDVARWGALAHYVTMDASGSLWGALGRSALPCKGPRANPNAGERAMEGLRLCIGRFRCPHLTLVFLGFGVLGVLGF